MSKAQTKRVKKVKRASLLAGLAEYGPAKVFDEMAEGRGRVRRVYEGLRDSLQLVDPVRLAEGRASLEASFLCREVCQDLAHAMISLCRLVKIPARYVSGYVCSGDRGEMRGAEASHAWVEVHLGEAGWLGLDPTNRCHAGEMHIKVAHGRDYRDVPPLSGNYHGNVQGTLAVTVAVRKV
jgi:transglutaminase-like putative cysteine protease